MGKSDDRPGFRLIFRPWITLPDGTKIYAKDKGLKAFPIWVPDGQQK